MQINLRIHAFWSAANKVRCLDSIISPDFIAEISSLYLASVAAQAGLCLAWLETPEDTSCRVVAHLIWREAKYFPNMCSNNFENWLTNKDFMPKLNFE